MLTENLDLNLQSNYKGKNSQNQMSFINYSFDLNNLCKYCKINISNTMNYCYHCGGDFKSENKLKFYKKYVIEEEYKCIDCNAPLEEEFRYCYNCRRDHDPYGFYALLK